MNMKGTSKEELIHHVNRLLQGYVGRINNSKKYWLSNAFSTYQ